MNDSFEHFPELRALLDALCDETITPEQVQRLEELVLSHVEAEAFYVQYMSTYADLARHFAGSPRATEQSLRSRVDAVPAARPSRRKRFWLLGGGALGLTAVAAALLLTLWPGPNTTAPPKRHPLAPEALDNTIAIMHQASGAQWDQSDLPTSPGAPLQPGWLRLKSGIAQIEFYSGATVILEGPVEFRLISRTEAYCASGKLRATIPPQAKGFTLGSPQLNLVDRGTEFGLQVGKRTEVHVFQGAVELHDPSADAEPLKHKELTTGQSVRVDEGGFRSIAQKPAAFRTAEDVATASANELRDRHRNWLAAATSLRQDQSLLVRYAFQEENPWSRTLPDQAGGLRHDGVIVGCLWGTGRWPGKHGLEFKRVSDRVRFHVPGEYDSITMMTWVRVDALPNRNNALMMSDGWEPGEMHWQIGDDGMLVLGIQQDPKGRGAHYDAPNLLTPERFGQWVHLAVVYDRASREVIHYVDGKAALNLPIEFDIPLRIGDAELGNWNVSTHRNSTPVRNLTGGMDEFLLFSRALSEKEIDQLYSQGRPPR